MSRGFRLTPRTSIQRADPRSARIPNPTTDPSHNYHQQGRSHASQSRRNTLLAAIAVFLPKPMVCGACCMCCGGMCCAWCVVPCVWCDVCGVWRSTCVAWNVCAWCVRAACAHGMSVWCVRAEWPRAARVHVMHVVCAPPCRPLRWLLINCSGPGPTWQMARITNVK